MTLLALDLGSSSIKGTLLSGNSLQVTDVVAEPCPAPISGLPPGHFELDPTQVVAATRRVIERLLARGERIDALVSCGQMGGVILVDEHGAARSNYLSWRDQRTLAPHPAGRGSYFDRLRQSLSDEDWRALGREVQPGSALCLLEWLAELDQLPADRVGPVSLGDYVLRQLTHGRHAMTRTQAIGLIDLQTLAFRRSRFEQSGLDRLLWPELVDEQAVVGTLDVGGREIPCYPCVGDHQCALAGTRLAPREMSINVSTGSQVGQLSESFQPGSYQTRPYFARRYLNAITHLPAGRSLNVLVDLLTELPRAAGVSVPDPWEYLARAAASAHDTELDVALTFFAGPLGEQGSVRGITTENFSAGPLFRAAFRSMADNYAWAVERLSRRDAWDRLVLSGGLVQKVPLLRDGIVARLGTPHRIATVPEETLGGLAVLYEAFIPE